MSIYLLPIVKNPPIIAYQNFANFLGILLNDNNYFKEFYGDYINVVWNNKNNKLTFLTSPYDHFYKDGCFLYVEGIHVKNDMSIYGSSPYEKVLEKSIEKIKSGFYVKGFFDEFFIPTKNAYQKRHYKHDFFIFGYDDIKQVFHAIGYTRNGKYESYIINKNDFLLSLKGLENLVFYKPGEYMFSITFLKVKEKNNYKLDLQKIKKGLFGYLFPFNINDNEKTYGIDGCNKMFDWIEKHFDLRQIRMIMEHKTTMLNRLKYLNDNDIINCKDEFNSYLQVSNKAIVAFNYAIKYQLNNKNEDLIMVINHLKSMQKIEYPILKKIYDMI